MKRLPCRMTASTSWKISLSRRSSASPPPATGYSPEIRTPAKPEKWPSSLMCRTLLSSSLSITGNGSTTCRQWPASGSSRLPSGPMMLEREVTISSRMESSGGFVTWANSWAK